MYLALDEQELLFQQDWVCGVWCFESKKNIDHHQLYPKAGHPVHSSRDKDDETELHPRQQLLPSLWESVASVKHFQPEAQN